MGYAVVQTCFNRKFRHWQNGFRSVHIRNAISPSLDFELNNNRTIQSTSTRPNISKISILSPYSRTSDEPVNEEERQGPRGLIGSLQNAVVNSRPDICSPLGHVQSQINRAKMSTKTSTLMEASKTLHGANKTLHEATLHSNVTLKIQPIATEHLRFTAFSDASFASAKVQDSHQGMIIMLCHKDLGINRTSVVNPILWHSKKIQKVAVSTLSAETMALAGAVDMLSWVRLYWAG